MGQEKINKNEFTGTIKIINGTGDEDWNNNIKYKKVIENKYDVVTFYYTIHYMMNNIDIVIDNLNRIMKPKCKIIITCMDGNKIHNDFKKYKQIEVRNRQEPIFAIIPLYNVSDKIPTYTESDKISEKDNNIIVYFKGAYGVSSGSVEPIIDVDKLIEIFKKNNIELIEKKNFADYNINVKKQMNPMQLRVSSYYMSLVFEYNI